MMQLVTPIVRPILYDSDNPSNYISNTMQNKYVQYIEIHTIHFNKFLIMNSNFILFLQMNKPPPLPSWLTEDSGKTKKSDVRS